MNNNHNSTITSTNKEEQVLEDIPMGSSLVPHSSHNFWKLESIHNPVYHVHEDHEDHLYTEEKHIYLKEHRFHKASHDKYKHALEKLPDGPLTKENQPKIHITQEEEKIFSFLLEVNNHFKLGTTLRVAGGWVRNKLLGLDGDDVDIAIDNMMGADFANYVSQYEKLKGLPSKAIGIISANPEQSKHLETATTHIFGQSIDFVNLRSEEYAEESRIPSNIKLGTPLQDANRRDLTINALFYNLNEQIIEDFTGKGMHDMKHRIVRTPLPPVQTFLDDPLRVLRSIRFACFFDFLIADEIMDAAHNHDVDVALAEKVSRERVGTELLKILKGHDPVGAFALIGEMKIRHIVFTYSTGDKKKKDLFPREYINPIPIEWKDQLQWENSLYRMRVMIKLAKKYNLSLDERVELLLAGFLSPITSHDMSREQIEEICYNLIVSSLRLPLKLAGNVSTIIYGAHYIKGKVLVCEENKASLDEQFFANIISEDRVLVGRWLKNTVKHLYDKSLMLCNVINTQGTEFTEKRCFRAVKFLKALNEQHVKLIELSQSSSPLKGNEISTALDVPPGPIIAEVGEDLSTFIFQNYPQIVDREQAFEWLAENAQTYKSKAELNPKKKQKK
ncbi:tRNA nucleotidyltransferase/poly(A) polymerase [Naegleria gruberi]|uniref:tRNA nucleotidyltransferase/poly(A) polymerase n=1 Tax=Naegleria gruberi TaxID=5762 RepID=D2V7H4_NAEGR|nr:tRNA nucleotidyltransferase/poly(A) polymerase [Naegleria gruberi]EFC47252.1 tRNA nucleotidyltransferase/poly(A) polymerase [Naegleria gruberi]|eukprot:XP_002679996.1 tRNA nucleotidyltransferase/poly(A) polymerase [Naegleria gruberi strain NEG-M]